MPTSMQVELGVPWAEDQLGVIAHLSKETLFFYRQKLVISC